MKPQHKIKQLSPGIAKCPTGIRGLDEITDGGPAQGPAHAHLRRSRLTQDAVGHGIHRAQRAASDYARSLLEASLDPLVTISAEGKITDVNKASVQATGVPREELIGTDFSDYFTEPEKAREGYRQVFAEGSVRDYPLAIRHVSGRVTDVLYNASVYRDASGQVLGVFAAARDITERKRAQEVLHSSEERLRLALDASNAGTWSWDVASNVSTWDERYHAQYGFAPEEPASFETWMTRVHPEDRQRLQTRIGALLEPGLDDTWNEEFRALHPVKGERWMAGLGRVARDPSGRATRFAGINLDITERKRAEERLKEYEKVVEGLPEMIAVVDRDYRYLIVNRAFLSYRGLGRGQVVGRTVAEVLGKEFFEQFVKEKLDECFAGRTARFELSYTYPDLGQRSLFVSYLPVEGPAGVDRAACVMEDITNGKRAQEELRASEVRYRRLFEAAKDGVLILDAETGMVEDVNPFLVQLLGISREALLRKKIWELGFFKDIVANQDHFKELQEAEYIRYDDKPLETADGRRIDVEFVSNVYGVSHQKVIQCNIRDISARKLTEWRALIYKDQLRALSARIETMREEERTRISREIHDELGQMLTGIKMDLRWMEHRLDEFGDDRRVNPILDKLAATSELTDATVKTVQRIAAELRPGILDKLGLPTALQYEVAQFQERTGIACQLVVPDDSLALPPEAATTFFRIFQEALTNVSRHAEAKAVEARLLLEGDACVLEIRDNGKGMAGVDLTNPKSLGLLGMQERAALLSGGVSFAPRPGGGTVVTVRIPSRPTSRGGV